MADPPKTHCLGPTVDIVSAYVSNNVALATDVPAIIVQVHQALATLGTTMARAASTAERPEPAVPIKKSITPDFLVCLEDGHRLKMLKRHLATFYGLTPDAYRKKWGLPSDYPMTSPNYSTKRSELAKSFGLGVGNTAKKGGRRRARPKPP